MEILKKILRIGGNVNYHKKKDKSKRYINYHERQDDLLGLHISIGLLVPITLLALVIKLTDKEPSNLEQKTENEIIINPTKVDTTNYQNSFNYLDYKKQ